MRSSERVALSVLVREEGVSAYLLQYYKFINHNCTVAVRSFHTRKQWSTKVFFFFFVLILVKGKENCYGKLKYLMLCVPVHPISPTLHRSGQVQFNHPLMCLLRTKSWLSFMLQSKQYLRNAMVVPSDADG